jgi:hypothetical protein
MRHLHDIVSLAEDDEPVFTLRAKDVVAADSVRHWADLAEAAGAGSEHMACVRDWADQMDAWRERNGGKVPDNPKHPREFGPRPEEETKQ